MLILLKFPHVEHVPNANGESSAWCCYHGSDMKRRDCVIRGLGGSVVIHLPCHLFPIAFMARV